MQLRGIYLNSFFLVSGIALGWQIKGHVTVDAAKQQAPVAFEIVAPQVVDHSESSQPSYEVLPTPAKTNNNQQISVQADQKKADTKLGLRERFEKFLDNREYLDAIDLYSDLDAGLISNADANVVDLRKSLFSRLKVFLKDHWYEDFIGLIEAYLSHYYDDSEALLLLANYNLDREYYLEAVGIYQLAFTYTHAPHIVRESFEGFVRKTHDRLTEERRWQELLSFYLSLADFGLQNTEHLLNIARLHHFLGDLRRAIAVLDDLRYDPVVGERASVLLEKINNRESPRPAIATNGTYPRHRIPVKGRGEHFIVSTLLNARAPVEFLIDTGASTTSMSQAQFDSISRLLDARYHGQRLFRTANGVARANLYLVPTFRLGNVELRNIEIAVLPSLGGYGLLGMNVLRNFRFEINQDAKELWLGDRR